VTLDLDATVVSWLAIASATVALLALVVAGVSWSRLSRMRRQYLLLQGDDGNESFVTAVSRKAAEVEQLRLVVDELRTDVASIRAHAAEAISHVAVVRYDAFNDMGGRMSFSAALLDDAGDGLVVSSINARAETRTYAKGVKAGGSDASLSPEEEQAIGYARPGEQKDR